MHKLLTIGRNLDNIPD